MPDTPYFTTQEFRDRFSDVNATEFPDEQVDAVRLVAEQSFEDACGVAFVPRTATETLSGADANRLRLGQRRVRAITSVTVDGDAVDPSTLTVGLGVVWNPAGWARGFQNVVVTYTYGYDVPPLRVKQAVMLLTRVWLVSGPVDERATQIPTESGGSINLATPGLLGATFGIPEVDATVQQYRRVAYVA